MARGSGPFEGASLVAAAAVAALAMLGGALFAAGWSEAGVRIAVRASAKVGVVLFALAFSASSLRALWRGEASAWLLRNRRYVGLSFAVFHILHLGALVALAVAFPDPFLAELDAPTLVGGGLAYAFLLALVLTSNDAAVRRLGRRRWSALHTAGCWYLWIVFAQSYAPRALAGGAVYVALAALLLAVPALRAARLLRARAARVGAAA